LEARLTVLTARRTELEHGLSATELYEAAAKPRLLALLEEKRLVDDELGQVEGDWLDTSEALEAMHGDGP
jgi:ATP-binding cassette subfamily F protein 3